MKKLTDEIVAKALGWHIGKRVRYKSCWLNYWVEPGHKKIKFYGKTNDPKFNYPPSFTTSLKTIVGEVARRKLYYAISRKPKMNARGTLCDAEVGNHSTYAWAETEPMALCQALLNYLEIKKEVK